MLSNGFQFRLTCVFDQCNTKPEKTFIKYHTAEEKNVKQMFLDSK